MIYSALNIVVTRIRESRVIAFSVRKPYCSTLVAGVENPDLSFISTENDLLYSPIVAFPLSRLPN